MIRIQKLKQPNRRSGHELAPKKSTTVRGVTIVNNNSFPVWVDKFTRKPWTPKKKKVAKKAVAKKETLDL